MLYLKKILITFAIIFVLINTASANETPTLKPWSVLLYGGITVNEDLKRIIVGDISDADERLFSTEIAYSIDKNNPLQHFLRYITDTIQLANNFAYRDSLNSSHAIFEDDIYFDFRWTKIPIILKEFPWHNYVATTFSAAEGVSYTSAVPYSERNPTPENSTKFLNYLMFEITFAAPSNPNLQFVTRIHHRSSAFGLYYHDHYAGSNTLGLGIRYCF